MDTRNKAILEDKIDEALSEICENDPECYITYNAVDLMADAAEVVYNTLIDADEWYEKEKPFDN